MEARNELKRIGRLGIDVTEDDEELLRRLRLVRKGQYINAAVLLFASDPLTWSPNLAVRVVSYASDKFGPISNDLLLSGPGVRVLYEVITAIQQRTGFSGQFVSGKIQHRDVPAYSGQNPDKSGHGHL